MLLRNQLLLYLVDNKYYVLQGELKDFPCCPMLTNAWGTSLLHMTIPLI